MTNLNSKLAVYAADPQFTIFPETIHAMSEMTDPQGKPLLSMAFSTHRDIITAIAYRGAENAPSALRGCAAVLCALCKGKAVMAADLLGPVDIAAYLTEELDDEAFYFAAIATLTLKNTLSSFADYRARVIKGNANP